MHESQEGASNGAFELRYKLYDEVVFWRNQLFEARRSGIASRR
jgi:hypothetical protein